MTPDLLVLFDIDGTLLIADGAGRRAMREALIGVYGTAGPIDTTSFAGRTDRGVVRELMMAAGLAEEAIRAGFEAFREAMVGTLDAALASGEHNVRACPGAADLVTALGAQPGVMLGLLTGNMAVTARSKLAWVGLPPEQFVVGAYGDDHEHRPELARLAIERGSALAGRRFEGRQVVVIGDTPADVTCGAAYGVRTVGVLTGWHDRDALAAAGADAIFDDLADTQAALQVILGD
jgi:phosphoglycolate phosphatase